MAPALHFASHGLDKKRRSEKVREYLMLMGMLLVMRSKNLTGNKHF